MPEVWGAAPSVPVIFLRTQISELLPHYALCDCHIDPVTTDRMSTPASLSAALSWAVDADLTLLSCPCPHVPPTGVTVTDGFRGDAGVGDHRTEPETPRVTERSPKASPIQGQVPGGQGLQRKAEVAGTSESGGHVRNAARTGATERVTIAIIYRARSHSKEFTLNPHNYGQDQSHFFSTWKQKKTPFPSLPCSRSSHVTGGQVLWEVYFF